MRWGSLFRERKSTMNIDTRSNDLIMEASPTVMFDVLGSLTELQAFFHQLNTSLVSYTLVQVSESQQINLNLEHFQLSFPASAMFKNPKLELFNCL